MDHVLERVESLLAGRAAAVIGLGNRLRGDDGIGSVIAGRLREHAVAPVFDAETVPENYLGALVALRPAVVLFIDALEHGGAPGSLSLHPIGALEPRAGGTHAPSLALLGRLLEAEGIDAWLLGIGPATTRLSAERSPAVEAAGERVVAAIAATLGVAEDCLV